MTPQAIDFGLSAFPLRMLASPPVGVHLQDYPDGGPAAVTALDEESLRIAHRRFVADLDLRGREGWLYAPEAAATAVEVVGRVALCARLPEVGALPLHAAGIVRNRAGLVFFGPSGAGKTTLASTARDVLSDELVVVQGPPWTVAASGFFGTLDAGSDARHAPVPLSGLLELGKGDGFALDPLPRDAAFRRLLGVIQVPALPRLWRLALAAAERLLREVPAFRMEWKREQPPWELLERELRGRS